MVEKKQKVYDFKEGEILLVDKPLHWTSFDVVNKIRWRLKKGFHQKRFKVGHAGTLDPLATGLLILCTGKSTKVAHTLSAEDKTYEGTFLLGKTTPSYDLETAFETETSVDHITEQQIQEVAMSFRGRQWQIPPVFSAKKVNGKRAYLAARKGQEIEIKANEIEITSFQVVAIRLPEVDVRITCSKGTYIRSIANDFGQRLKVGSTLVALRRVQSGEFDIKDAKTVEEWLTIIDDTLAENLD